MKKTTLRNWLLVATVTWGLATLASLPVLLFSVFLFDSPGSGTNVGVLSFVGGLLLLPVACVAGSATSWVFFNKDRPRPALYFALLPLIPLLVIVVGIVVIEVGYGGSLGS